MAMYSSNEILGIIERYSKTQEGKQKIKQAMKYDSAFVPKYADAKHSFHSKKQCRRAAEDMVDILRKHIVNDTQTNATDAGGHPYVRDGLKYFDVSAISAQDPSSVGPRQFSSKIVIDESALSRPSVTGGEGLHDVIALFVHGYDGTKSVHGVWEGKGSRPDIEIWTPYSRKGDDAFLRNAIDEFNKKYKGKAVATISKEYEVSKKSGGESK